MKRYKWFASSLLLILLGLAAWAFWLEPASLRNETTRLSIPKWPDACAGFRVALLSDLHVGSPFNGLAKLDNVVRLTNAAQPDLVLLAGDYVIHGILGGKFVEPEPIAERLGQLKARLGVFAVLGNHDWWYDATRIQNGFKPQAITILENQALAINSDACQFWLVGIGDFMEGRHDILQALSEVPPEQPVLAVTHNPDLFPDIPRRVSLTLAGHTHGGQVYLPLLGRLVVPSRYGQRYAIGHIIENGRHLVVTPGLGNSILPVRFLVPPEVTILDLYPDKEA